MSTLRTSLCILLLSLGLPATSIFAQSPWGRSKAGFFVQGAVQGIPAYHQIFDGFEVTDIQGEVRENTVQLYGEYGFSKKWTGIVVLPVRRAAREPLNPGDPPKTIVSGLGNTTLGIKRPFNVAGLQMAVTLLADLPATGKAQSGVRTGFDAFTVHPSFSLGKGFYRWYWYGYSGIGVRSDNYSGFGQTGGELGIRFKKVWTIAFADWMQSFENGSRAIPSSAENTGLFMDRQSWAAYGLKIIVETGRFTGLVLSGGGAAWGNNVANRPALGIGYYFKWD